MYSASFRSTVSLALAALGGGPLGGPRGPKDGGAVIVADICPCGSALETGCPLERAIRFTQGGALYPGTP